MVKHVQQFTGTLAILFTMNACHAQQTVPEISLREGLNDKFYIGAALNASQIEGTDPKGIAIVEKHFNSIVAENCMKSEEIHPEENRYDFTLPDKFIDFGEKNNMKIIGHTLIWHSQLPEWFYSDEKGENVSPEILKMRMHDHISTVVGRYKGRVHGWDVVNEALEENGSWRKSKFYEILGEEFIPLAFEYAHQADPDAELYYNDYSMANPEKRKGAVRLIRLLQERGCRIDAIGMQGHNGMQYPLLENFEESIRAFSATGVKVMITELDVSALPNPMHLGAEVSLNFDYTPEKDPYRNGLPEDASKAWNNRMFEFFDLFLKYHDVIDRVTLWGVTDNDSWKNDFPIRGRTDYPLLFDRNYEAKEVVERIIQKGKSF